MFSQPSRRLTNQHKAPSLDSACEVFFCICVVTASQCSTSQICIAGTMCLFKTGDASSHGPRRRAKFYILSPTALTPYRSLIHSKSISPLEEKSSGPIITFDPASTCGVGSSERTEHFGNSNALSQQRCERQRRALAA